MGPLLNSVSALIVEAAQGFPPPGVWLNIKNIVPLRNGFWGKTRKDSSVNCSKKALGSDKLAAHSDRSPL